MSISVFALVIQGDSLGVEVFLDYAAADHRYDEIRREWLELNDDEPIDEDQWEAFEEENLEGALDIVYCDLELSDVLKSYFEAIRDALVRYDSNLQAESATVDDGLSVSQLRALAQGQEVADRAFDAFVKIKAILGL